MLSVNGGCAAGIIVGYDEKTVYIATAAHVADLSTPPFPVVAVKFEGLSKSPSVGKFLPQFEKKDRGDLAVVTVNRDDSVNKFLDNLDFALLSPVPLGPVDIPVTSIGCFGGAEWSSGTNETLLRPEQGYLRFQSDVGEGQSGGGLYNEAWELIGMPLDVGDNGVYARPIAKILEDTRKWGVPIRLVARTLKNRARGADEIAREAAAIAQQKARESKARELAAFSTESLSNDPEKSILLGMQAVNATLQFGQPPVPAAEDALHQAILSSQVRLTLKGHKALVKSVAWSPDGKRLATGSNDGSAKVWDATSGKEELTLEARYHLPVNSVAWSPDGKRLATASEDGTAKVWDAASGQELLTLGHDNSPVFSVTWSPDGKRLATEDLSHGAKVWDATSGQEVLALKGCNSDVVTWSPDGKRLATGCSDEWAAKIWDAASGQEVLTLKEHTGPVSSVAWSPDGTRLATTVTKDGTVKVWDAATGTEVLIVKDPRVSGVAWSPDGKRLATGSFDLTEKLWDESGQEMLTTLKVWDAKTGREMLSLKGHTIGVESVVWSPDGKRLATGNGDGTAKVWDAASRQEVLTLKGHVYSVAWSPDGKQLATGSKDQAKVWDAASGQEVLTLKGPDNSVVAWSPDGKRLAFGSKTTVWDVPSRQKVLTLKGQKGGMSGAAWSPDGKQLATGSSDETAKVWDAATGKEVLTLKGQRGMSSVAWSPDGKQLATTIDYDAAMVWDAATGKEVLTLKGHTGQVYSVAWSPDGKQLATGSRDETAKVWDAATGKEVLTLKGHTGDVYSVAWSPDGGRLATASEDGTAKVWDAASGQQVLNLKGHTGRVYSVAWSPDGKWLATTSDDETVQIYVLGIRGLLDLARMRVTRDLTPDECKRYFQSETCPPLP